LTRSPAILKQASEFIARRHRIQDERVMNDLLMVFAIAVCAGLTWLLIAGCDRLMGGK
jgi:hypothetical protein